MVKKNCSKLCQCLDEVRPVFVASYCCCLLTGVIPPEVKERHDLTRCKMCSILNHARENLVLGCKYLSLCINLPYGFVQLCCLKGRYLVNLDVVVSVNSFCRGLTGIPKSPRRVYICDIWKVSLQKLSKQRKRRVPPPPVLAGLWITIPGLSEKGCCGKMSTRNQCCRNWTNCTKH